MLSSYICNIVTIQLIFSTYRSSSDYITRIMHNYLKQLYGTMIKGNNM